MDLPSLYEGLLGASYPALAPPLRAVHDRRTVKRLSGRCEIRGGNGLARWLARIGRLPQPHVDVAVQIVIERDGHGETWSRRFGDRPLRSRLRARGECLEERLGAMVLRFALVATPEGIDWRFRGARLAGTPIRIGWLLSCTATERVIDHRYAFDVAASVRAIGLLVHYRGWLVEDAP